MEITYRLDVRRIIIVITILGDDDFTNDVSIINYQNVSIDNFTAFQQPLIFNDS